MITLTRLLYPNVSFNVAKASGQLAGKTIVITGASFGIGEALTRALFQFDVRLILVARTTEKLLTLQEESKTFQAQVTIFSCDFYQEESVQELCNALAPLRIDYFVSNAGKSMMRSFAESSQRIHDYRRTIAVNYLAPIHLISALAASFNQANTHIVNVSSYSVLMKTPPQWSAYISSKKAMHSWIESNTLELAEKCISISNIYFPLVESRMKNMNPTYTHTPAMTMDTAVAVLINALINKNYHFKPWWHIPFQLLLFLARPSWAFFWRQKMKSKRN